MKEQTFQHHAVIYAPVADLYEYIQNPKTYAEPNIFAKHVSNVKEDIDGIISFDLKERESFFVRTKSLIKSYTVVKGRKLCEVDFEIYPKFDIGIKVTIYFTLEDIGSGRTLATKTSVIEAPSLVMKYVANKVDKGETAYMRNFKKIMEEKSWRE